MAKIENIGNKVPNQINSLPPKGKQIIGELIQKDTVEKTSDNLFSKMIVNEPGLSKRFYKRDFAIIKKASKKDVMMRTWIKDVNSPQKKTKENVRQMAKATSHKTAKTPTLKMSKTAAAKPKPKKK